MKRRIMYGKIKRKSLRRLTERMRVSSDALGICKGSGELKMCAGLSYVC